MRGRAEHSVVEIHICERNHIVAKAWRNSGHNNKNNRDVLGSYVFHTSQKPRLVLWGIRGSQLYERGLENR